MKKRKITQGSGITEFELARLEFSGAAGLAEFGAWIEAESSKTRKAIQDHDGLFAAHVSPAVAICEQVLSGPDDPDAGDADDRPKLFAERILRQIAKAQIMLDANDPAMAASLAFTAGILFERAMMKWQWEPDAQRGAKVAGGARNAAHRTNRRHDKPREARFARMAELVPHIGVDKAAAQCETEGLGSLGAIKKQWNRHHKKRDT